MKFSLQIFSFSILKSFTVTLLVIFQTFLVPLQVFGQFTDDFSDGDFSNNPAWIGKTSDFSVVDGVLKLTVPAVAASSSLATESNVALGGSWEFMVRLGFNPSSTNYARIYLVSSSANLSGPLNGYFVMLGNTADEVSLYRQTGTTRTKIIDGVDGRLNSSTVSMKVKVVCDGLGEWQLFSDVGLTGTYIQEGSANDVTHASGNYFGIQCVYTATRSDKFFFDDFEVKKLPVVDFDPPVLQKLEAISKHELEIVFSEAVDQISAENVSHYTVDQAIGNPLSATLQHDLRTVLLAFNAEFPNGVECNITVQEVSDLSGNKMEKTNNKFIFFTIVQPQPKDIIISEFMADPSPRQELPEAEFIEIYNRSNHAFDLSQWKITDGTSTGTLTNQILLPKAFLVITSNSHAADFSVYGKVMGISGFPSLNNAGDNIILKDATNRVIDSLRYADSWYKDTQKRQGGWTLEIIDPDNTCAEAENWIASANPDGGTPGKQNSVYAEKPDLTPPALIAVNPSSARHLDLIFNEKLQKSVPLTQHITVTPARNIATIALQQPDLTVIKVTLAEPLDEKTLYTIKVKEIYDCAGNKILDAHNTFEFALPQAATSGDIVINELLFNPKPGGVDFIEVVNTSSKYIDLKNWTLGNFENGEIKNQRVISTQPFMMKPGAYYVFTPNPNLLKGEYLQGVEKNFYELALPSFNDDSGSASLTDHNGNLIDAFVYDSKMHSRFVQDAEGVSLERVSFSLATDNGQNWKSASAQHGFATPGYLNSNARPEQSFDTNITIQPEAFVPGYGQPDFTQIHYQFDQGNFVANVKIYDAQGRVVKSIAENQLLGSSGFFRWDGDRDDGARCRIGNYLVWFEVFNSEGVAKTIRKRVAVAGRF